jgi:hypothetical protein
MHKSYSDAVGASRTYLLEERGDIWHNTICHHYARPLPHGACQVQSGVSVTSRRHKRYCRLSKAGLFMVDNEDSIEERVAGKEND